MLCEIYCNIKTARLHVSTISESKFLSCLFSVTADYNVVGIKNPKKNCLRSASFAKKAKQKLGDKL